MVGILAPPAEEVTTPRLTVLAEAAAKLADHLRRSVVTVQGRSSGAGAGAIWRSDGLVITNHHVAPGDTAEVTTWDERRFTASVIAHDAANDLAALRIDASDLDAVEPGDSDAVRAGQVVIAVGHPWGQRSAVSSGIVFSAHGRAQVDGVPLENAIRADLVLAPGNSGGPMADSQGRVIGINSMIAGGLAIAVPSNTVKRFLEDGLDPPGQLGIVGQGVDLPAAPGGAPAGLIITEVEAASPAEWAGLIPGDALLGIGDGEAGLHSVARDLQRLRAGRDVNLRLLRGGEAIQVNVTPRART